MKKLFVVLAVAAMIALVAGTAMAGIANTKHDMSSGGGQVISGDFSELCVYCHTPHHASTTMDPLWNRTGQASGAFTTYGTTIAGTTASTTIHPTSLACLSCHDGTTSINAVINKQGPGIGAGATATTVRDNQATVAGNLGTNLQNDHPISIVYLTGTASLRAVTANASAAVVKLTAVNTVQAINGTGGSTVECGSCHDPHVNTNTMFMRLSNAGSAMCISCHDK